MIDVMITTFDNPYDPFEEFNSWFAFDVEKGYYSCSKIARIAQLTEDMSEIEIQAEKERAIDALIKNDFLNVFRKVYKNNTNTQQEAPNDQ